MDWYYLDPDNNAKVPDGRHCERCKQKIVSGQEALRIVVHTENPWFRKADRTDEKTALIGRGCYEKMVQKYGIMETIQN
jgi:hypothetical protein